jgi:hypothetical protein
MGMGQGVTGREGRIRDWVLGKLNRKGRNEDAKIARRTRISLRSLRFFFALLAAKFFAVFALLLCAFA